MHYQSQQEFIQLYVVFSKSGLKEEEVEGEFGLDLGVLAATRLVGRRAQND